MSIIVSTPDYELFKNRQYDLILVKYQPMIKHESRRYSYLHDDALEYEDIYQENMIVAWQAIEYIQKRIQQKKTTLSNKLYFGPMLKQRLVKYSQSREGKQKSKVNQNLLPIFCNVESDCLFSNINFIVEAEFQNLYDDFTKNLTNKERNFVYNMEKLKSCNKVSKKMKMTYSLTLKMMHDLKNKCIQFIQQRGYELN